MLKEDISDNPPPYIIIYILLALFIVLTSVTIHYNDNQKNKIIFNLNLCCLIVSILVILISIPLIYFDEGVNVDKMLSS